MKLLSQTLKGSLVLMIALFSNSVVPSGIAFALEGDVPPPATEQVDPVTAETPTLPAVTETPPQVTDEPPAAQDPTPTPQDQPPAPSEETPTPPAEEQSPLVAARVIEPPVRPQPPQQPKVTICHATNSFSNPYVKIEVDQNAADGVAGNSGNSADHYDEHTGVLFTAGVAPHSWGDIIPAIPGVHGGRNWTAAGQEILRNDCKVAISLTVTPGVCVKDEGSSTLTITVYGTAKDSILVVTGPNGEVYREAIDVDKDGEVVSPSFPITINDLNAGEYTVSVLSKNGKDTLKEVTATIETCQPTVIDEVTPPTFYDICGRDRDYVYIPSQEGVTYRLTTADGTEKVSQGRHYVSGDVIVTATANDDYEFGEETDNGPWNHAFTDKQCLDISKTGVTPTDTNGDGEIGAGDIVTWYITVTNLGDAKDDSMHNLKVTDSAATSLTDDGDIDYLAAGDEVTLKATTVLTDEDVEACEASNTASVIGYRHSREQDRVSHYSDEWTSEDPDFSDSTSASVEFDCAEEGEVLGTSTIITPVPQVLATTAKLPAELPATGGENSTPLLLGVVLSGLTYFVVLRRQTT